MVVLGGGRFLMSEVPLYTPNVDFSMVAGDFLEVRAWQTTLKLKIRVRSTSPSTLEQQTAQSETDFGCQFDQTLHFRLLHGRRRFPRGIPLFPHSGLRRKFRPEIFSNLGS